MSSLVYMNNQSVTLNYEVEKAIDYAFSEGKFILKLYDYLKLTNTKRIEVEEFICSNTAKSLQSIIVDLDEYILGGHDNQHKMLREAYGYISKPQARKIKNYLNGILDDARRYHYDKRPGRRKKTNK